MNPNAAPLEILWTLIAVTGLGATGRAYHLAAQDFKRLREGHPQNALLLWVAQQQLLFELLRYGTLLALCTVGLLVLSIPPRPAGEHSQIVALVSWGNLVIGSLILLHTFHALRFRRSIRRRADELQEKG